MPGFPAKKYVYVTYTGLDDYLVLSRFQVTEDNTKAILSSQEKILTVENWIKVHQCGHIVFWSKKEIPVADTGWNTWEELNFEPASSLGGINFCWNLSKANLCPKECDDKEIAWPFYEFSHEDGHCAVIGGRVGYVRFACDILSVALMPL